MKITKVETMVHRSAIYDEPVIEHKKETTYFLLNIMLVKCLQFLKKSVEVLSLGKLIMLVYETSQNSYNPTCDKYLVILGKPKSPKSLFYDKIYSKEIVTTKQTISKKES